MDVALISKSDVASVLEPIWRDIPETASRVRERIEPVLDYCMAMGFRKNDENPALLKGGLRHILPRRAKADQGHHASMPYADLPAFWARLAGQAGIAAQAVRFAILTAARSGEVRGATWGEVDLTAAVWALPASRMKMGKPHVIPLTAAALAVLADAAAIRQSDMLFNGAKADAALSDMSLSAVLTRIIHEGSGEGYCRRFAGLGTRRIGRRGGAFLAGSAAGRRWG